MHILSFMRVADIACKLLLFSCLKLSFAADSISQFQTLTDGETLVSSDGTYEFGFFSPPGSTNRRYVGIWFKNIPVQTIVWVANRVKPINDSNGILTLNSNGNLALTHNNTHNTTLVWDISTSLRKQAQKKPMAQLLNSGNLVVREEDEEDEEAYLWQSFDYPTDTILAGMKFGWDLRFNLNRQLTAWKSPDDPAPGDLSWGLVLHNYPELYMMKGSEVFHRTGPWNGVYFSGYPQTHPTLDYRFVSNKDEIYYQWSLNSSVISRLVLNQTTYSRHRSAWMDNNWVDFNSKPEDYCDIYGRCGAYGNCFITKSPVCQCLKGFRPKSPQQWNSLDGSQGCVRNKPLDIRQKLKDGFVKFVGLKVPDTTHTWVDNTIGLEECRKKCLNNCSCMAFTNSDISGQGSGCVMWFGDLVDMRQFQAGGQDLYIRMDASEIDAKPGQKKKLTIIVASTFASISGILLLGCYCICKFRRKMKTDYSDAENTNNGCDEDDSDLPLLDLSTIVAATDNFSLKNKVGEGGFGPVYKGRLMDGQEIAVKKLSTSSRQGITELKNEVRLIANLQHRNLVKLLGYCSQGQQNILVYEYMPNSSLDSFIFDPTKGRLLDWSKRFHIICGIVKGLLYLHQDSRLRIIHRDLKASNILLDDMLNPKISDFGLAKFFGGDQIEGNTNKVVGTHGYMAPEYAIDGLFSVKSDVFSFGILLMEIISSKKNRRYYQVDSSLNLISHAWKLWKDGKATELIDSNMEESCTILEALRCIHVSLLCVQQYPNDRPSMSSVVLMLSSEMKLAEPKEPGFFPKNITAEVNSSLSSTNKITCTSLDGR